MEIKANSFVSVKVNRIITIACVDDIQDGYVLCSHAITSKDEKPFVATKDLLADYGGELLEEVSLVTPEEFDIVVDTAIIPANKFKNL